uniref:VWFA domain-containing protein n=1 Tax=Setaria digitata TaxID=48799 RepID=A0A915PJB4_9BILA
MPLVEVNIEIAREQIGLATGDPTNNVYNWFAQCKEGPLDVIFLVDTNTRYFSDFGKQRDKIADIVRHLENVSVGRDASYGVIAFQRRPVILLPIASPSASQPEKVVDCIRTPKAVTESDSSPAKALELAAQQFVRSARPSSSKLVILAHDGVSMDLIAETLEAKSSLERIGATVFAITSVAKPNIAALMGYTTKREHVYAAESDRNVFLEKMERVIGQCVHFPESLSRNSSIKSADLQRAVALGIRTYNEGEHGNEKSTFEKADLMIVMDSSGSVFNTFEDERKLVQDLIESLEPATFEDGRVQVSMMSFSSSVEPVIPFKINRTRDEIVEKLKKIKFAGGGTRIANAVDMALADLSRWRRKDAIQIFLLISDGNGQELWYVAQTSGKKLQSANVEVFAVPTGRDYNLNELLLYTGDIKRVYFEAEQQRFIRRIAFLINKCVRANLSRPYVTTDVKLGSNINFTTSVKPITEIPREFFNVNDQSIFKAKGSRLLESNKQNSKLAKDLRTELITNKDVEAGQNEKNAIAKVIENFAQSRTSGNLDLLFVVDRSPDLPNDLRNQLKLMSELVDEVTDEDISKERIRVAIITFVREARLDLEWGKAITKAQVLQHFTSIEYTSSNSSVVAGITFATQYAERARRPNAQLMIVLVSDGNTRDLQYSVLMAAKKLHKLEDVDIYTVTTSKQYTFMKLETLTRDKWKVYVDGRTRRFVTDVGKRLMKKTDGKDESVDAKHSPLIASIESHKDPIDLIILVDKSTASDHDFELSKKILSELLRNLSVIIYESRLRVLLISFTDAAHVEIELRKSTKKDDVLYAIEKLQNGQSNRSISTAVNTALLQLSVPGETLRQRIFVILTDGGSQDSIETVSDTAAKLQQIAAEVYIIPITGNYSKDELNMYAGKRGKLLTELNSPEKKFAYSIPSNSSKSVSEDFVETKLDQFLVEKGTVATTIFAGRPHIASKPYGIMLSAVEDQTNHAPFDFHLPVGETKSKAEIKDPKCLVDLIFIVDTSQSVEKAFQKQLQFAITLIKEVPPSAFDNDIRVAAVTFSSRARTSFQFNEFNNQTMILSALHSLTHSGGNTSSVSGINLAIKEIQERGRQGVRRMIVFISDGNSQDRWEDLLDASNRLHATDAIVYAITANHDYYFSELELYARNKWLVYVDGRRKRFLDDGILSLLKCQNPPLSVSSVSPQMEIVKPLFSDANKPVVRELLQPISTLSCENDSVDLLFIIDTSTSIESNFNNQKIFAMDLIKMIPMENFLERLAVAVVGFSDSGRVHLKFRKKQRQDDILYELERLEHTGGGTSLAAGVDTALLEINSNGRPSARLIVVIFSSGNNQDEWQLTQKAALNLRKTNGEIYAVTQFRQNDLKEYTRTATHVYVGDRVESFLQDINSVVLNCEKRPSNRKLSMINASVEETDADSLIGSAREDPEKAKQQGIAEKGKKERNDLKEREESTTNRLSSNNDLALDAKPVEPTRISETLKRDRYSKMDLEIILDASTSRQQVFEHQRELALSLIERLPIDAGGTHVAVGINSFTSVPTLRQTLGLGRDKQMVRHAIEGIKYNGGSTFTAQAVQLSVQDLERGRRPDAIQVVVLMNDGLSQDPWEKVLEASQLLRNTGAELFGVALGENIDLRELKHYIGRNDRIYRDNTTERFLTDVVSLLSAGENCVVPGAAVSLKNTKSLSNKLVNQICNTPNLDITVLFDNALKITNLSDQSISSNRYLLLDILGSLPVTRSSGRVKISVIVFNSKPELIASMIDSQDRSEVFSKVESIKPKPGKPSYAKAISFAVREYSKSHRPDARGILVIVGDGRSDDNLHERNNAVKHLHIWSALRTLNPATGVQISPGPIAALSQQFFSSKVFYGSRRFKIKGLSTYAVDSGKWMDVEALSRYTGSSDNVFNYDRNADFARIVLDAAVAADKAQCGETSSPHAVQFSALTTVVTNCSSSERPNQNKEWKKDVSGKLDFDLKRFENEKVIIKEETTAMVAVRNAQPITKFIGGTLGKQETQERIEKRKQAERMSSSSPNPRLSSSQATPKSGIYRINNSTTANSTTIFSPGCEIDAMVLIDSSGSVEEAFSHEKELASEVIRRLRIGPNSTRVAIIKFASKEKVKTVWSFDDPQEQEEVLQALLRILFTSGTTAIDAALLQAAIEYSTAKGARPGHAIPFGIIFTDGFGQKDTTEAATVLRNLIPNMFAVAVNSQHSFNEGELIRIAGSKDRVIMDHDIDKLYRVLEKITRTC